MKGRGWVLVAVVVLAIGMVLVSQLAFQWGVGWGGEIAFPQAVRPHWEMGPRETGGLATHLARLGGQYLLAILALFVIPGPIRSMADRLENGGRPLARYLLLGVLLAFATGAVAVASVLSAHTFPLVFLLVGALSLVGLVGIVALVYALGRGLLQWGGFSARRPLASLGLGMLLLYALIQVPFLGPLILLTAWSIGCGVVLGTRWGSGRPWTLAPLMEDRTA